MQILKTEIVTKTKIESNYHVDGNIEYRKLELDFKVFKICNVPIFEQIINSREIKTENFEPVKTEIFVA